MSATGPPYSLDQLNFFKFQSIVRDEFPKAMRQVFKTLWNKKLPIPWDDEVAVRNQLSVLEAHTAKIPTGKSYEKWDCTALFAATIFANTFKDAAGRTLNGQYLTPPPGKFRFKVTSSTGNQDETFALAIDQLRRLRNEHVHLPNTQLIDKTTFHYYIYHAKIAFEALQFDTSYIDYIRKLPESEFPTDNVSELKKRVEEKQGDKKRFHYIVGLLLFILFFVARGDIQSFLESLKPVPSGKIYNMHKEEVGLSLMLRMSLRLHAQNALKLQYAKGLKSLSKRDVVPRWMNPSNSMFIGRRWLFNQLDNLFEENNDISGVLLVGDPGSGKTALMRQLVNSPDNSSRFIHENIIAYHFCKYDERTTRDGETFVKSLVEQLSGKVTEFKESIQTPEIQNKLDKCKDDPIGCVKMTLLKPLDALKMPSKTKKFILIDALDECRENEGSYKSVIIEILHGRMNRLPSWIKLLLSSRNEITITGKMSEIGVETVDIRATSKNNLDDIRSFAQEIISRHDFRKKNGESMREKLNESIETILSQSDGNFLFIHELLEDWAKNPDKINLTSIPSGMKYLYARSFRERYQINELQRFAKIFEVLLASNSPPTFKRLYGILTLTDQMDHYKLDEVQDKLSSFLHFNNGTVRIFHKSFAEWLTDHDKPIDGFSIKKSRGHRYIADYLFDHYDQRQNELTVQGLYELSLRVLNGEMLPKHVRKLEDLNSEVLDQSGECILHHLARNRESTGVLEVFIQQFESVDIFNKKGLTPTYYATVTRNYLNLKLLIRRRADVNYVPYFPDRCTLNFPSSIYSFEYYSLTFIAAYKGYSEIVELLINNGAHFYKQDKCGWKPLHAAAKEGSPKTVELLMNKTDKTSSNLFALHQAAVFNHSDVLKLLLENGVRDECRPCKRNYEDASKFSSSIDQYLETNCGSVLSIAVENSNQKMVKILLSYGKETLECKSLAGLTPLMHAVEGNDTGIVTLLLDEGADVEAQCEAKSFHEWVQSEYLLKIIYAKYYCFCTSKAIHISVILGASKITTKLIERKANQLSRDCMGWSADDLAAMHNQYINTNLFNNKTVIRYLAVCGSVKAFEILSKNYSNFNDVLTSVDEDGMTLVHLATLGLTNVFSSVCTIINCTVFKCPYMNAVQKHDREEQYLKTIKLLTEITPQHINKEDKHGRTALHYSVMVRSPGVFKHLIQRGSDWKITDENGNTALEFALKRSIDFINLGPCSTVFYSLLNPSKITISDEMHVHCLIKLMDLEPAMGHRDTWTSRIIVDYMVHNNLPLSWYTLLKIDVDLYCLSHKHLDRRTATFYAVRQAIATISELLKVFKLDVEVKCEVPYQYSIWHVLALYSTGRTLENYSSLQSFVNTHPMGFRILDEYYDAAGYLPIHLAVLGGNTDMIDWFVNQGVGIWKKTRSGWNAFHLLLTHCSPPMLDTVLSHITSNPVYNLSSGSDFWCNTTSASLSLLHIATLNGFKCLRYIQKNTFIPVPHLPFTSCNNTHGIVLLYLIQLYNDMWPESTTADWKDLGLVIDGTLSKYPEQEAEYHLVYNKFFVTPHVNLNLKFEVNALDLFRRPGISDALPYRHVIDEQIKRCNYRCWRSASHANRSFLSVFRTIFIRNDTFDPRSDGFIDIVQQMAKMRYYCVKMFYKVNTALWILVSKAYTCSRKCRCLEIMRLLQDEFTSKPFVFANVGRFIADRMGWNDTSFNSQNADFRYRWPFDFLLRKALKMDKDYDYLKILTPIDE